MTLLSVFTIALICTTFTFIFTASENERYRQQMEQYESQKTSDSSNIERYKQPKPENRDVGEIEPNAKG